MASSQYVTRHSGALFFVEVAFHDGSVGFSESYSATKFAEIVDDICTGQFDHEIKRVIGVNPVLGLSAEISADVAESICQRFQNDFSAMPEQARELCERSGYDVAAMLAEQGQADADWTFHIRAEAPSRRSHL